MHNKNGNHKLLGTYENSIMELIESNEIISIKGSNENEYYMKKMKATLVTIPSFLDYINAGLDMNLICGVDFTGSNGNPEYSSSLHYINNSQNQYLSAITEISKILLNFDTDKQVPMFGFGAVIPNYSNDTSHCFAMNGNIFRPEVNELSGITDCYQQIL